MRKLFAAVPVCLSILYACADGGPASDHAHEGESDGIGVATSALAATASVTDAVNDAACTTTLVKGLSVQLVEEIQCLRPNSMARIDNLDNVALGAAVFPYLQTPAVSALKAVVAARGTQLSINSALRTLPQQYLLYRWYKTGRCGIKLAATPGTSNHESAVAVDVEDSAGWRSFFQGKNWRWLGAGDPVHYDFLGGGTIELKGLSVLAFQRLWNRNHPEDPIAMDGDYGPNTESRLAQSPIGGFAVGAKCDADAGPVDVDAGPSDQGGGGLLVSEVPDAPEPADESGNNVETGCSVRDPRDASGISALFLLMGSAILLARRKR